jgi:hypothetical protein
VKNVIVRKTNDIFGREKTQKAIDDLFCGIGYRYVLKLREISLLALVFACVFG